jgi:hypothetical protein
VPGGVLAGPWVRDPLWRNARAVPSLDLRFADNKSLIDAVTGASLVTFTRASSKTVTNSARVLETVGIDVPAFDHDPTTGESLGLLVEEQRTNLLLRSEEFDDASWAKVSSTISANTTTAPSGTVTADTITWGALATAEVYQFVTLTAAAHTLSVYARSSTGTKKFRLKYYNGTTDLFSTEFTATTAWQQFSYTITGVAVAGNVSIRNSSPAEAGDLIVWGAQLEAGAFPTSYIPTTTAAVTRSADVASITGSAFTGFYNQNQITVYAETRQIGDILGFAFALSDGTDNNRIAQFRNTVTVTSRHTVAGSGFNPGNITISSSQTLARSAIASIAGSSGAAVNGVLATPSTPVAMPAVDRLQIALGAPGATQLNGTLRRLCCWGQRLPDSTLQQITQ